MANSNATVMITGESGTGKELLARMLHDQSDRCGANFVPINCAAIPAELLESEVFGHERGAFTGAGARHIGYAERAREGVFFLDEVGELPLALQPKLLRLLEARVFQRVGGHEALPFRARIIAATNADLLARVRKGLFREDLLYRLDVIGVEIPPLRRRGEDILPLAMAFLDLSGGGAPRRFDPGAEAALLAHDWPGNARELRNRVERASILADGPAITASDLFPTRIAESSSPTLAASMEVAERITISAALQSAGWDVALAAERTLVVACVTTKRCWR
jgi:two-component system response regulator HydG